MKLIRNAIMYTVLLGFSGAALSNGLVSGTRILEIGSYTDNRIFVKTGSLVNPAGCPSTTFGLNKSEPNFEEMYTALMIAMTRYGKVNLQISTSSCIDNQYPRITYVGIIP